MPYRFLIVGAGFSGSVLARELVTHLDCEIEVRERKDHVGGHCYTYVDKETGIMIHKHGPHIFNTDSREIWDYFNGFSPLLHYTHRVKAMYNGRVYSLPINLATLNTFFGKTFNPVQAQALLSELGESVIENPANFEEQAIKMIGKELYKAFFYGYTKKQWGCDPKELPASILKRLPIRFDYNDNYHLHPYTGIPASGYTDFTKKLLDHPKILLKLNTPFTRNAAVEKEFDHVFYTGPIDAYFNYSAGRLSYRTLRFEEEVLDGSFQGCTQMNFCDEEIPYTRITEHKYFTPQKQFRKTIIFREYSSAARPGDTPYYPLRLREDMLTFEKYRHLASEQKTVSFLGRLGTYRYIDMQHVIKESIHFAKTFSTAIKTGGKAAVFPSSISDNS